MLKTLLYSLKKYYHFFKTGLMRGLPAEIKNGFPAKKLKIVCITGTDGKTTSSTLLYHVLKSAGKKVALLSTVAAYFGDQEIETGLHVTSPSPDALHKLMRKMVDEGIEYLVLEFTSHGAYQQRLWGIKPLIAGVTNVNYEHLDYHLNYQNYLEAKASFLKKAKTIVLNQDDMSFYRLRKLISNKKHNFLSYSAEEKLAPVIKKALQQRFSEPFNQMNSRLVTKMALELGLTEKEIAASIESFPGVPGRMQFIKNSRGLKIVVDFAHTPQGLDAALRAMRKIMKEEQSRGRLIAVYGCAGLRDQVKRPTMGKIGVELADLVIFTAEDPRTENVWSIIRQMKEQLTEGHDKIVTIIDRQKAIDFAINRLAKKGDYIGIFGKGPEKSMCYGKIEYPWSESLAVEKALQNKNN
ncbi:MAG: Mur ligase family protein [Patescibacteria group bacterium]